MVARDGEGCFTWREPSLRLPLFVAFSVLLHGLLLLGQQSTSVPLLADIGTQAISVTLATATAQPAVPASASLTTAISEKPLDTSHVKGAPTQVEQDVSTAAFIDNDTLKFTKEALPPSSPQRMPRPSDSEALDSGLRRNDEISPPAEPEQFSATSDREQAQHNFLLGHVRSLLTQYLNYPPRARKRGWEGEVLVGFRVDADGRLGNVHLARSSGHSLLDESALAALNRIGNIPLTGSTHFSPAELQLPVLYQLRDG